jgi:hypothetical protein
MHLETYKNNRRRDSSKTENLEIDFDEGIYLAKVRPGAL